MKHVIQRAKVTDVGEFAVTFQIIDGHRHPNGTDLVTIRTDRPDECRLSFAVGDTYRVIGDCNFVALGGAKVRDYETSSGWHLVPPHVSDEEALSMFSDAE